MTRIDGALSAKWHRDLGGLMEARRNSNMHCLIRLMRWSLHLGQEQLMSSKDVQRAVLNELKNAAQPVTITQLMSRVRQNQPTVKVADFDIRLAILAMKAVGQVEAKGSNLVVARG